MLGQLISDLPPSQHLFSPSEIATNIMLYGLYPELIALPQNTTYLKNLADSVVFKDILELNLIDNKAKAKQLLQLLAYQIGSLINYSEIATKLNIDQRTVKRYLEIFEQSFIIYRLYPYSTRARNELTKTPKIYFWDLGLRNAIINNFDSFQIRPDTGALFENFIITELAKLNSYTKAGYQLNYWRSKAGAEADLVLSNNKSLHAFEIKLNKGKFTSAFLNRYPHAKTKVITLGNFY
jgi:predicted AAA+ superfamily ATPase